MSERDIVLAVFWGLWLIDGARLAAAGTLGFVNVFGRGRANVLPGRLQFPSPWPGGWRGLAADVPLSFSPAGVSNRPVGSASRPASGPTHAEAWRWEEINDVAARDGALWINGRRFCADTGHVTAPELQAWAALSPEERTMALRRRLRVWLRPAQLKRRATILRARTVTASLANATLLVLFAAATACILVSGSERLPEAWSAWIARTWPLWAGYGLALHGVGVFSAWRAHRRLQPSAGKKRGALFFSAAMLPPQALRLRALVGDGFFFVQHPLAYTLAFGNERDRARFAFQTLADLRWPIGEQADSVFAREIAAWHRAEFTPVAERALVAAGLPMKKLFAAPMPDSSASCLYCPRCRDQFIVASGHCPHGVKLEPLAAREK